MTSDTTVYNATTTQLNIINNSGWRKRFILICGLLLLFIGLLMTVVFSFSHYTHTPPEHSHAEDSATGADAEDIKHDENWVVFIFGLILAFLGLIVLIVYFLYNRRLSTSSGLIILPKPKQRILVVEQNTSTTTNEEKAELMRNELKNEKERCIEKSIPLQNQNHYKPRNFNQHGYGRQPQQRPLPINSQWAPCPIATLDEFDCSLRSSMNSVWSQHVHQQMNDCRDDDDEVDSNEDGYSFQSVVLP